MPDRVIRPTVIDIDLSAITHNFEVIRSRVSSARMMPIVKANAYGHGIVEVSRHLESIGADSLGVAVLEEGIELREAGIKIPILVLGGIVGAQIQYYLDYDLQITASSVAKLDAIEETAQAAKRRAKIQLKIDTGMERIGVHHYSAEPFLERAARCEHSDIAGIYSHFATVKEPDAAFARVQLERFTECCDKLEKKLGYCLTRHIASTGAIIQLPESSLDLVRPGIGIYGIYPSSTLRGDIDLKPVMKLRSQVVYFKVVRKGAGVSYGHTWTAPQDTRVITVPIGYGDGYMRRLSNKGSVLIRGKRYPIIGTICMDQFMVDIGQDEAYNGDEVVLVGRQGNEEITANEIADLVETTPHEIPVATHVRIPRRYRS